MGQRRGDPLPKLFGARWLLAPLYLGLGLLLIAFAIHLARELIDIALSALVLTEVNLILASLTLIDLTLVAGLIVMVMLSGYENFVSTTEIAEARGNVAWLGKLDFSHLKLRVAATIVIISAVQLLKYYMEIDSVANDKLMWMVIIHLAFVVSALLLTVMDRLGVEEQK